LLRRNANVDGNRDHKAVCFSFRIAAKMRTVHVATGKKTERDSFTSRGRGAGCRRGRTE
jgi:hypothetical protein